MKVSVIMIEILLTMSINVLTFNAVAVSIISYRDPGNNFINGSCSRKQRGTMEVENNRVIYISELVVMIVLMTKYNN